MKSKLVQVKQGDDSPLIWIKSSKFDEKVIVKGDLLCQSNGWHVTYSSTEMRSFELDNYPFTVTTTREVAQQLKTIETHEQLFKQIPDLHIIGLVSEVLGINLYNTYFFITPDNHGLVWCSTGYDEGSVLMYGGHSVE